VTVNLASAQSYHLGRMHASLYQHVLDLVLDISDVTIQHNQLVQTATALPCVNVNNQLQNKPIHSSATRLAY
jgi:hypothetical protein